MINFDELAVEYVAEMDKVAAMPAEEQAEAMKAVDDRMFETIDRDNMDQITSMQKAVEALLSARIEKAVGQDSEAENVAEEAVQELVKAPEEPVAAE